jgi:glycosyltransferase involved in cell wall biosynthesis
MADSLLCQRIAVISNGLNPPYDEGIKKFAFQFTNTLLALNQFDATILKIGENSSWLKRKFFIETEMRRRLSKLNPSIIFYIPTSSGSFASFLRMSILRLQLWRNNTRWVMILLQPNIFPGWKRRLSRLLTPDLILTQSERAYEYYVNNHFAVDFINAGADLNVFKPVSRDEKSKLRSKYGYGEEEFIILHVGHIRAERNLGIFVELKKKVNARIVIVGSTSTRRDEEILAFLKSSNIEVRTEYIEHIEELYQMSDCYIFPTRLDAAAIGMPLSILEAMGCNIPVIATRFGRLPSIIAEGDGFLYFDRDGEISNCVEMIKEMQMIGTRRKIESLSWDNVVKDAIGKSGGSR